MKLTQKTLLIGLLLVALTGVGTPPAGAQGITITVNSSRSGSVKPVQDAAVLIGRKDAIDLEYNGPNDVLKRRDRSALVATLRTDRSGVARLPNLPAGTYTVILWKKGYTPSIEYLTYPQSMEYDLILDEQVGHTGRHQTLSY